MHNFPFQRLQADLAKLIARTAPGERLLNEPELAKQMGVSRATLREAMRTFETQGIIRRQAYREGCKKLIEVALSGDGVDDGYHLGIIPSAPSLRPAA